MKRTATYKLLPDGEFLVEVTNAEELPMTYKGRFSIYMLDRFCNDKGIENYIGLIQKIVLGMTLKDYADLVLYAFQDYYREDVKQCPWTTTKVMDDLIDKCGGMEGAMDLFKHAIGRVTKLQGDTANTTAADDEKKN